MNSSSSFIGNLILSSVTISGLVIIAYKSATSLRARIDLEIDDAADKDEADAIIGPTKAVEQRSISVRNRKERAGAPASVANLLLFSPGRKSLAGRLRRFSTIHERASGAEAAGQAAERVLRFWVLFGLLHLLTSLGIPYAFEFRAVIVILGMIPSRIGGPAIERIFLFLAKPIMSRLLPRASRYLLVYFHALIASLSPLLRSLFEAIVSLVTPLSRTEALLGLEMGLKNASNGLSQERRTRRRLEVKRNQISSESGVVQENEDLSLGGEDDVDDVFFESVDADFLDDADLLRLASSTPLMAKRKM
jgi:hypothetical protein